MLAKGCMAWWVGIIWTMALPPSVASGAAPPTGDWLKVLSRAVVFEHDRTDPYDLQNLHGFNHATSVVAVPDGGVIAAWFSGPFEASVHQSIMSAQSDDGGATWHAAELLHDAPRTSDFDPAFIRDGDRVWTFHSTGRWTRWPFAKNPADAPPAVGAKSFQIWARMSDDDGRTWSPAQMPVPAPGWNCRSNGIRLSTGELVLPVHYLDPPHKSAVMWSADGGQTWELSAEVVAPPKVTAAEPTVAELSDGALLMCLRTRDGTMWSARSEDRGRTWSAPQPTETAAGSSSHNLFRHSSGALLLTYNPGPPPLRTSLVMRRSLDDGVTWSEPVELASVDEAAAPGPDDPDAPWTRQVSYPSVCENSDGTLVVVWGWIEIGNLKQAGVIHAAHVRLTP